MKTKILGLLVIVTLFISTIAVAQQKSQEGGDRLPEHKKEMKMKKHGKAHANHMGFFTEEQQEEVKGIRLETAKKIKPLKNQLNELQAHQQTLASAEKADLAAINKNIDKMSSVKAEMAKAMAASHQKVRSLLTEEQLLKFDTMKGKRGKGGHQQNFGRMKNNNKFSRGKRS